MPDNCFQLSKVQFQDLADTIYPMLNPYEFVLLAQTWNTKKGHCYHLKYGELIRKFRVIKDKRFLEFVIYAEPVEIEIHFGKGDKRYCSDHLQRIGESEKHTETNSDHIKQSPLEIMLIERTMAFVNQATGFFNNDDQFWLDLDNSVIQRESC